MFVDDVAFNMVAQVKTLASIYKDRVEILEATSGAWALDLVKKEL